MCVADAIAVVFAPDRSTGAQGKGLFRASHFTMSTVYSAAGELQPPTAAVDWDALETECAKQKNGRGFFLANDSHEAWIAAVILRAATSDKPNSLPIVCKQDGKPCVDAKRVLSSLSPSDLTMVEKKACAEPRWCFRMYLRPSGAPPGDSWIADVDARFSKVNAGGWGVPTVTTVALQYDSPPREK
jgi:hypothetical protein